MSRISIINLVYFYAFLWLYLIFLFILKKLMVKAIHYLFLGGGIYKTLSLFCYQRFESIFNKNIYDIEITLSVFFIYLKL